MYKNHSVIHTQIQTSYLKLLVSQEVKGVGSEGGVPLSLCIYNGLFTANQTHPSFLAMTPKAFKNLTFMKRKYNTTPPLHNLLMKAALRFAKSSYTRLQIKQRGCVCFGQQV